MSESREPTQVDTRRPRHRSRLITGGPKQRSPAWNRVVGSDPGLLRLRTALQAVATIGAAMAAERLFVHLTGALLIDTHGAVLAPPQQALVDAQHHGITVIAIMLGAVIGFLASFASSLFPTPRATLVNFALFPVPMVAGLALGLLLGDHRVLALGSLVVVIAVGGYCRRFGPTGFIGGNLLFMGDFFGFFLHQQVGIGAVGWLGAEIVVGTAVAILMQFTIFYPSRRAALRRMVRSYAVRSSEVSSRALDLFDRPVDERVRVARSLRRRLVRLNETALLIDAQLSNAAVVPDEWSAAELHQRLFDSELAVSTLTRLSERLVELDLSAEMRLQVRGTLEAVCDLDLLRVELAARELLGLLRDTPVLVPVAAPDGVEPGLDRSGHIVVHRFATSALRYVETDRAWRAAMPADDAGADGDDVVDAPFRSSVTAFGGWLPGSALVSAAASNDATGHRMHVRLTPHTRVAIQMGVAVTAAIVLGDLLSERRFYWAVIAAFVTFMGANNAGEQLRKGTLRIVGTLVGVFVGALGAHLVGQSTGAAITVILVALFLALYLMRISYAFMVIGITVMVSQLYVQLDEFSDSLLRLRMEETAIGAAVAVVTVLCVVPLHHAGVVRVAARHYLEALQATLDLAAWRLVGASSDHELRGVIRALDAAHHTLITTTVPVGVPFAGRLSSPDSRTARLLSAAAASHGYARSLIVDTSLAGALPAEAHTDLERARARLATSIGELTAASEHSDAAARTYVRSAGLFDVVSSRFADDDLTSARQLALRDFQLVDDTLAALSEHTGLTVTALDTAGAVPATESVAPGADAVRVE